MPDEAQPLSPKVRPGGTASAQPDAPTAAEPTAASGVPRNSGDGPARRGPE
ncbi:GTP pyrophosphokinase, partial [Streptomyces sp. MnatMP-M27]